MDWTEFIHKLLKCWFQIKTEKINIRIFSILLQARMAQLVACRLADPAIPNQTKAREIIYPD